MSMFDIYLSRSGTNATTGGSLPISLADIEGHYNGNAAVTAVEIPVEAVSDEQFWTISATDAAIRIDFRTPVTATTGWLIHAGETRFFGARIGQSPSVVLAA